MLLSFVTRLGRRQVRRLVGGDAGAWAIRIPLVTLVVAATLGLRISR